MKSIDRRSFLTGLSATPVLLQCSLSGAQAATAGFKLGVDETSALPGMAWASAIRDAIAGAFIARKKADEKLLCCPLCES